VRDPARLFLHDGVLHLVAYAHSIDFGARGYVNLVELASILEGVTDELDALLGTLTMSVKSAHVYETDVDYMSAVLIDNP
jgi:thymidylate synthase